MDSELAICGSICAVDAFHEPGLLVCGDELEANRSEGVIDEIKIPIGVTLIPSLFLFLQFSLLVFGDGLEKDRGVDHVGA